jgi:hypothetical protein
VYNSSTFTPMQSDGVLVLGQDQDLVGGGFEADQSFSGAIAQFGMWDRQLTLKEISTLSECNSESALSGNVFTLDSQDTLNSWITSNVITNYVTLLSLCVPSPIINRLFMIEKVSHNQISKICSVIGGKMPIPTSLETAKKGRDSPIVKNYS